MASLDTVDIVRQQWAKAIPELDTRALAITHRITALATLLNKDAEALFAQFGVTGPTFDVLAALYAAGPEHRLSPTQLTRGRLVSSGGMTARLDLAESSGLVSRSRAEHDRRGVTVTLLDAGVRVVREGVSALIAKENPLKATLGAEDRESAVRLLTRLLQPDSEGPTNTKAAPTESLIALWVSAFSDQDPWLVHLLGVIPLLSARVERESRKAVVSLGLTPNAFALLCALRRAGAPFRLSPTDLYQDVVLSPAGVTGQLEKLARSGLIERSPDPNDGRMNRATLTKSGLKVVNQTIGDFVMRHEWLLRPLSEDERELLARHLRQILSSLESR
ncbi:MAG: MarR family winged helix-turn-helix transcriptional regulator [Candidatus Dormibacterales bacterium]